MGEKKSGVEDTITYYSQREADYEAKVDELTTRLQVNTAFVVIDDN